LKICGSSSRLVRRIKTSDSGHPRIAPGRLAGRIQIGLFSVHWTEFPDLEDRSVEAYPLMTKDEQAGAFEFDRRCD